MQPRECSFHESSPMLLWAFDVTAAFESPILHAPVNNPNKLIGPQASLRCWLWREEMLFMSPGEKSQTHLRSPTSPPCIPEGTRSRRTLFLPTQLPRCPT